MLLRIGFTGVELAGVAMILSGTVINVRIRVGLVEMHDLFVDVRFVSAGSAERFARKDIDGDTTRRSRQSGRGSVSMRVPVIVVFEVFENIAHIEKRVAIQADIDESRLHARQDSSDFSFVDAADEGELFFALNVNFD
jgi:hypothetical protein